MSQQILFNTATMASTKEMKALKRARVAKALASNTSGSMRTIGERAGVRSAAGPDLGPTIVAIPLQEMDLHYPNESRAWRLTGNMFVCPQCRHHVILERLCRDFEAPLFRIVCDSGCGVGTPAFKSSKEAGFHWKLTVTLSKL